MCKLIKFLAVTAVLVSASIHAQDWQEGVHYQAIGTPASAPDDRVVVIDGFGYPCPACRRFLPYMDSWQENQPDYVEVRHMPIALQPGWELYARAYYTAEVMGIAEQSHEAMFRALHDERRQFRSFADIAELYTDFGVEAETFVNTSNSFAVDARLRQNRNDVRAFGVRGTPSIIVQGKWRVSPNPFNSYEDMLAAISYLVEREAEALGLGNGAAEPAETQADANAEQAEADS